MKKEKLDIIYEDKNIIVVNKPARLLTVATETEKEKTLFHKVLEYEKKKHKSNKVFIVHRLDYDTSGIIVFAKNMKIKSMLQDNWNNLASLREYVAVVDGKPMYNKQTIKTWLKENKNMVTYSSKRVNDGKLAITKYEVIVSNSKYSFLKIHILTGRKNQIRVHMKEIGHPIIGDTKYGSNNNQAKRMMLHANKLELIHPMTKEKLTFEARIPKEFNKMIDVTKFTL